jgi:CubicO group peptidase (beta-lactamase class C family)
VESPDGNHLLRAWGMADLEGGIPNTPATVFEAGSVSKQFTVAVVVLLALEGRLSLEDDVRTHLPEVPDFGEPILLHHLIHHVSGLRDWGSVAAISGWGRGARTHTHAHVLEIVGRQRALNFPPGFEYSYSNTGFNLLAMVVERVTGEPFAQVSRDRIFQPLGLHQTRWRDDYRRIVPGRSSAYTSDGAGGYRIDRPIEDVHGNGGLLTTVEDLLRWDAALRSGTLGGPAFVELMHRTGVLSSGRSIAYAGGLQVGELDGLPEVAHTGSTAGYRAFLGRYPDQGFAVALLCNSGEVNPGRVGREVARHFLGQEGALPTAGAPTAGGAAPAGIELTANAAEARTGLYRNARTGAPLRIHLQGGTLRLDDDDGDLLVPVSPRELHRLDSSSPHPIRLVFRESSPGERAPFVMMEGDWEGDEFLPTQEVSPGPEELDAYRGTFFSDEAVAEFSIDVENEELVLRRRPDTRLVLTPLYPDAFSASSLGRILFHRDSQGGVTELSVQQARVYDLRFHRRR